MRITAQGILNYIDTEDQKRLLEQQRQDQREATAINIISKYGIGDLDSSNLAGATGTKSGKSKSLGTSLETDLIRLQDDFDLSAEILAPILASGDKTAIPRLRTLLEGQKEKYVEDNRSFPTELARNIVENAAIELPSVNEVDFSMYEDYIGREMDALYKQIFTSAFGSTSGSVAFENVTYAEPVNFEDLDKSIKTLTTSQTLLAKQEKNILQKELNKLADIENKTDAQRDAFKLITDRKTALDSALAAVKDNPAEIINLYGNSFYNKILKTPYGERLKTLPTPPILTQAEYQYPQVATVQMANILLDAGIFKSGDEVRIGELDDAVKTLGYED